MSLLRNVNVAFQDSDSVTNIDGNNGTVYGGILLDEYN